MSVFFGIDEHQAHGFIDKNVMCIPHTPKGKLDLHAVVSSIKNEDVVFIKSCTSQLDLHIKAVGIVQSDYPVESNMGVCLPVEWVWQGEKVSENIDETSSLCCEALYEEHNIQVQKEIIDLLPDRYRLPQEW
jgi:hypothetical protein